MYLIRGKFLRCKTNISFFAFNHGKESISLKNAVRSLTHYGPVLLIKAPGTSENL